MIICIYIYIIYYFILILFHVQYIQMAWIIYNWYIMGIYDCTIAIQWLYNVYAMARSFDICKQEFDMALSQDGDTPHGTKPI